MPVYRIQTAQYGELLKSDDRIADARRLPAHRSARHPDRLPPLWLHAVPGPAWAGGAL